MCQVTDFHMKRLHPVLQSGFHVAYSGIFSVWSLKLLLDKCALLLLLIPV